MDQPLVSVIIPAYNAERFIRDALDSVLNQSYSNIELIVVDDGSTDRTAEIVNEYGNKICCFNKVNGGVATARNLGIKHSLGKYVAFLDADDIWEAEKIEKQVIFLEKNIDFGIVTTSVFFIDIFGAPSHGFSLRSIYPKDGWNFENLLKRFCLFPSAILVRKDVVNAVGFFDDDQSAAEDIDYFLRILKKYKLAVIDEPLTRYRIRNSDSLGSSVYSYMEREKVLRKYDGMIEIKPSVMKEAYFNLYNSWGKHFLWLNKFEEARTVLLMALRMKIAWDPIFFLVKTYLKPLLKKWRKID